MIGMIQHSSSRFSYVNLFQENSSWLTSGNEIHQEIIQNINTSLYLPVLPLSNCITTPSKAEILS